LYGALVHPEEPSGTAIYQNRVRIAQLCKPSLDLRELQDRLIGVKGENPEVEGRLAELSGFFQKMSNQSA